MSAVMYNQAEPISSREISTQIVERSVDIEQKHKLVSEFLASHNLDALLIQHPDNFSWFTAGGKNTLSCSQESVAALFITPDARVVICSNVDSALMFDHELPGLGFQLKERPWHEPRQLIVDDLCRGRQVASDTGCRQTANAKAELQAMRLPLSRLDCDHMRQLGRHVSHAIEATARNCQIGQSECEIAGELAHRLLKHGVEPEQIQVMADGRGSRYRHWSHCEETLSSYCVISATGRKRGLRVGAGRTVSFGPPPEELRESYQKAMLMQTTGMYFSQPDWELFEIWNRVKRIYEKFHCPDEWQRAEQAEIIGYSRCEVPVVPNSEFRLTTRMALHWHPSVGPAAAGDTILVTSDGFELLTPADHWPQLQIQIKGTSISVPDILRRDRTIDFPSDSVLG